MKVREKMLARQMRAQGASIIKISKELNVSKGTVSIWVRDIRLSEGQIEALKIRNGQKGADANYEKALNSRKHYQSIGREFVKNNDERYIAACMLYWAEGSKDKKQLTFANSDVHMMKFFMEFLRDYFQIGNEIQVRVNCYLNNGLEIEEIEDYWLSNLELPRTCIRKAVIKEEGKSKGKLPYGICTIRIGSVKVVQQIFGSIQEYIGFEKKEWLGERV